MDVKTNFLITCQQAFLTAGSNNLNLIGIFTTINAQRFPLVYPHFALVANLDVDAAGPHTLSTVIMGPDGSELGKTALPVTVSAPNFQVIANFENMRFAGPGTYRLDVDVDGVPAGSRSIQVNLVVAPKGKVQNFA